MNRPCRYALTCLALVLIAPAADAQEEGAARFLHKVLSYGRNLADCLRSDAKTGYALRGSAKAVDGDTLQIGDDAVRLWGIDAPEQAQTCDRPDGSYPCGLEAQSHLQAWLTRNPPDDPGRVLCDVLAHNDDGRPIARCLAGHVDVGAWIISQGYAWSLQGEAYRFLEHDAIRQGLGFWKHGEEGFRNPQEWRTD